MRFAIQCMLMVSAFNVSSVALAEEPNEAGKRKAVACVSCHGAAGISNSPIWPNLAGQKSAYLEKQLKAFRAGERKDAMMNAMAKPLSDQDIKDIAAYYSSLK